MNTIPDRVADIRSRIPSDVEILAAAKTRSLEAVRQVLDAGIGTIGHNYVQEAAHQIDALGRSTCSWHLIGHLQRNKVRAAAALFDVIQTIDSLRLARALSRACEDLQTEMAILIEVNSAREPQKAGVVLEDVCDLVDECAGFPNLRIAGLMTMGPANLDPSATRDCFRETRALFDQLRSEDPAGTRIHTLSMGMSASYQIAVEEGATMIRLGTSLFGPRE